MIDVIITAYNCRDTLGRALASLETQIDNRFNVTIVDDNSSEEIKDIVDKHSKSLNIKYIRNDRNMGCGMSRQVGIDGSDADYVMFLDSDDILMPYTIKVLSDVIDKRPNADLFACQFYVYVDDKIKTITDRTHCHGKLYKRDFLNKYEIKAAPQIKFADDSYFNSQCFSLADSVIVLNQPIYMWIRSEDSITFSKEYKEHNISDFIKAMRLSVCKILQYLPLDKITFIDSVVENITNMCKNEKLYLTRDEKSAICKELNVFEKIIGRNIDVKL